MSKSTRFSLYKILLPGAVWIQVSTSEYSQMLRWLLQRPRSVDGELTPAGEGVDRLLWFSVEWGEHIAIPERHFYRFREIVDGGDADSVSFEDEQMLTALYAPERSRVTGEEVYARLLSAAGAVDEPTVAEGHAEGEGDD